MAALDQPDAEEEGYRAVHLKSVPAATRHHAPAWELLGVLALTGLLTLYWFRHAWVHPTGFQVGIAGDADEYDWFFSWVPHAIAHGLNPLLSTYVNAPKGANMMWNTSVLLPALVMSPFTDLFGPVFSYNLVITLAPALDTCFAYWAFRRWCLRVPSLVGALVFAFCPYIAAQSPGHLAQVLMMSAPLLLIVLDRLLVVQGGKAWLDGAALGLLCLAQLLTSEEVFAMEAAVAVVVLVVLGIINRSSLQAHRLYAQRGLVMAAGVFVVLAAPFLGYQYLGPYRVEGVHPWNTYVSDLLNFVVPTNITRSAPSWAINLSTHFLGQGEDGAYLGLPLIALAIFGLWVGRKKGVVWAAVTVALVAAVFSMGPTLHIYGHNTHFMLPDNLLQRLPAMKNLLPARFAGITALGMGLLVAVGLSHAARMTCNCKMGVWGLAVAAMYFAAPINGFPDSLALPYPAFTTGWACPKVAPSRGPGKPVVALVMPAGDELDLLWQAESHFCYAMPSSTGFTGTHPVTKYLPALMAVSDGDPDPTTPTPKMRQEFAAELEQYHVQEVIVSPESPVSPPWTPEGQAILVVWLEHMLGSPPVQYKEMNFAYKWAVPPYNEIATGVFPKH